MLSVIDSYQPFWRTLSVILLLISGVALIGLQYKPEGWVLLGVFLLSLMLLESKAAKDLLLVGISLAILGITEINTTISYRHMLETGLLLSLAVVVPYIVSRFIYKDTTIQFTLGRFKEWSTKQYAYIALTAILAYFVVPFYLVSSGAYINWPSQSDTSSLIRLFIGTNGLGIWDELFFVVVVLALLKQYMRFGLANLTQAILWTAFLYELGFTGWGPLAVFPFALLQGYIFSKTHSLIYIVAIHLTVDFILFLALVNAHNPEVFNLFFR